MDSRSISWQKKIFTKSVGDNVGVVEEMMCVVYASVTNRA